MCAPRQRESWSGWPIRLVRPPSKLAPRRHCGDAFVRATWPVVSLTGSSIASSTGARHTRTSFALASSSVLGRTTRRRAEASPTRRLLLLSNSRDPAGNYLVHPQREIRAFLGDRVRTALFIPYAGVTSAGSGATWDAYA